MHIKCRKISCSGEKPLKKLINAAYIKCRICLTAYIRLRLFLIDGTDRVLNIFPGQLVCAE